MGIELFFTLLFLLAIHIWVCDLILSLFKKHSTFYPFLFIAVLLFINSEALLFLSYLCIYSLINSDFLSSIYFYLTYFTGLLFLFLQIYEYQLLYFYISDSFYASSFYLITGLHFSHVIVGVILLGLTFTSLYNVKLFYLNIQLSYWHFVEIIWIVLYLVFYSSFGRVIPR